MLMARQATDGHLRHGPIPAPIQLPSFRSLLAETGQLDSVAFGGQQRPATVPEPHLHSHLPTFESSRQPPPYQQPLFSPHVTDFGPRPISQGYRQPQRPVSDPYDYTRPDHQDQKYHAHAYPDLRSPANSQFDGQVQSKTVVAERVIEDKGLCYVYSDGTTCPKSINGDTVNPKWGTTKAGKPRKRLGQACNTCREKKIRCDPQLPKCAQCLKFNRECRFESSVRGSVRGTQGTSPGSASPLSDRRGSVQHERNASSASVETSLEHDPLRNPGSAGSPHHQSLPSPQSIDPPRKKRKFSHSPNMEASQQVKRPMMPPRMDFDASIDPFLVDTQLAQHYLDQFFARFNEQLSHVFPQRLFRQWLTHEVHKTSTDLLVLYSMLLVGTMYSSIHGRREHANVFERIIESRIGHEALQPSLQVVQTMLLLGYYKMSDGQISAASALSSYALRISYDTGLNLERSRNPGAVQQRPCFGFDDDVFNECRRRSFWAVYILDTLLQCCVVSGGRIESIVCELRIPCKDSAYEGGKVSEQPVAVFHHQGPHDLPESPTMGKMALLIGGFAILRDWTAWNRSMSHVSAIEVEASYADHQGQFLRRLQRWEQLIDPRPVEAEEDISASLQSSPKKSTMRTRGLFVLYHLIKMSVHRHVRHGPLKAWQVEYNVREARNEAFDLLRLLHKRQKSQQLADEPITMSSPLAGFAALQAIDIVTSAGSIKSVLEPNHVEDRGQGRRERTKTGSSQTFSALLTAGITALEALSLNWDIAKQQVDVAQHRFSQVLFKVKASQAVGFFVRKALCKSFGEGMDVFYELPKVELFRAIGTKDRVRDEADLFEVSGLQSPR